MDTGTWIASVAAIVGTLLVGLGLAKQVRDTTRADKLRAEDREDKRVADARVDERNRCAEIVQGLRDQIAEVSADRNSERARADGLQELINRSRFGGQS